MIVFENSPDCVLRDAREIINPEKLPESGFQSYNELTSDAVAKKSDFLESVTRNPHLEYKRFSDLSGMDKGIIHLAKSIDKLAACSMDDEAQSVTEASLGYRAMEMHYIKVLAQLDYVVNENRDVGATLELTAEARELSELLYGKVNPEVRDGALNSVWQAIDRDGYSPKAEQLRRDLMYGFTSAEGYHVGPMRRADNPDLRLPEFGEAEAWAGEHFQAQNADIYAALDDFWSGKVAEHGPGYVCGPKDIAEAFDLVIDVRDPDRKSGVQAKLVEGKTALSWESPEMAVLIGADRQPINDIDTLFTLSCHEFGIHGQRAINGLKTDIPVLGMGMYVEDPASPDYLTFEEGYAVTLESAMNGSPAEWKGGSINYYLGVAFADEGDDFRSVFEKTWRYNLLKNLESPGQNITEDMISKARSAAYTNCVRIFRGSQLDVSEQLGLDIPPVTYNKDLSYLNGRVKAMNYIKDAYGRRDTHALDVVLLGKFDPTSQLQNRIATAAFNRAGMLAPI